MTSFCFIVVLAACSDAQQTPERSTGLMKGQLAPDFTIKDTDGNPYSLSSFRNKSAVCLVFWATWCPYCIQEIPKLKKYHAQYAEKGLVILSIDIAVNDPIGRVKAFQQQYSLPYPVLYDQEGVATRLYGIMGVPVSIIIDRSGIIQYRGYALPENIEHLLKQLF